MPGRGHFERGIKSEYLEVLGPVFAHSVRPLLVNKDLWSLKLEEVFYQIPLPYYIPHLLIPSFDQLKHPDRFAIMAVSLSSIPLGFLLQGLFHQYCWQILLKWHLF